MALPGSRPAPCVNPDEFERRLRTRSVQQARLDDPPSKLAQAAEFPPPGPSCSGPNVARHQTETTAVDSEDQQAFDVDDLRAWWKRGLSQGRTESPSRDRKLIRGGVRTGRRRHSWFSFRAQGRRAWCAKRAARRALRQRYCQGRTGGETASTPADVSTMPPTGLSGATPVAPKVDTQACDARLPGIGANYRS